jgi:DNA anti-recombination protein RmuC
MSLPIMSNLSQLPLNLQQIQQLLTSHQEHLTQLNIKPVHQLVANPKMATFDESDANKQQQQQQQQHVVSIDSSMTGAASQFNRPRPTISPTPQSIQQSNEPSGSVHSSIGHFFDASSAASSSVQQAASQQLDKILQNDQQQLQQQIENVFHNSISAPTTISQSSSNVNVNPNLSSSNSQAPQVHSQLLTQSQPNTINLNQQNSVP